jgi:hypothetical protein
VRLDVILNNLVMQQFKVQLVLALGVSVVAYNIHTSAPFRDEIIVVLVNKARNSGSIHKSLLLLWVEFLLLGIPILLRACQALAPLPQR